MCNLDRPVYRFGRIVRGERPLELSKKEATDVARELVKQSSSITERIKNALEEIDLTKADLGDVPVSAREISAWLGDSNKLIADVQKFPVILVNFPKICLQIGDAQLECRFCITVCVEKKKSKCWLRFNLLPGNSLQHGEGKMRYVFFRLVTYLSEQIINPIVDEYISVIRDTVSRHENNGLVEHYTIDIRSASSEVVALQDAYNIRFKDFPIEDSVSVESLDDAVLAQFSELGIHRDELPEQKWNEVDGFQERLVGYSSTREFAHRFGPGVQEYLNALMILRFGKNRAHIYAVGYDPLPNEAALPDNFPSLGHIISLNVSGEYARKF